MRSIAYRQLFSDMLWNAIENAKKKSTSVMTTKKQKTYEVFMARCYVLSDLFVRDCECADFTNGQIDSLQDDVKKVLF